MKRDSSKIILLAGLLLVLSAAVAYLQPWQGLVDAETRVWRLTLIGRDGTEKVLSYMELTSLPAYTGEGGFFSTVGTIYGPYTAKGVPLEGLCSQVGGVSPGDAVMVSAKDGYSTVLSYEQVTGEFPAYTPDFKEVPGAELKTILMYELDGRRLTAEGGKPLRLAVVGTGQGLLTEGNYWVKWIEKIEVLKVR